MPGVGTSGLILGHRLIKPRLADAVAFKTLIQSDLGTSSSVGRAKVSPVSHALELYSTSRKAINGRIPFFKSVSF